MDVEFTGESGLVVFDDEGERKYTTYDISVMEEDERGRYYRGIMGNWDGRIVTINDHKPLPKLRALINEYPPNIMSLPKLEVRYGKIGLLRYEKVWVRVRGNRSTVLENRGTLR